MCPHKRTYWRHLANTIELLLPSAHPSPQPKRQIDRFSRFCAAHGRKPPYFTMGDPFSKNCPFSWGDLGPHLIHDSSRHNPNCITIASAIFAQATVECPYTLHWAPLFPKIAPSHGGSWPHLIRYLGPIRAHKPNGISISSAVFAQMTAECPYTLHWDAPFPQNCPFPWGIWSDPHLIHGSLGSAESSTQMECRSVQSF